MLDERIDIIASLNRLAEEQARELTTLRSENDRLMKAAVMGLVDRLERLPQAVSEPYGRTFCKHCRAEFIRPKQRSKVCPRCFAMMGAARAERLLASHRKPQLVRSA